MPESTLYQETRIPSAWLQWWQEARYVPILSMICMSVMAASDGVEYDDDDDDEDEALLLLLLASVRPGCVARKRRTCRANDNT